MSSLYTEIIQDACRFPAHRGQISAPTHQHEDENPLCGDRIRVALRIEGDRIVEARFDGHGCAISQAAAELLLQRIEGESIGEVDVLTREDLLTEMGLTSITPARLKCALLSLGVLRLALATGAVAG